MKRDIDSVVALVKAQLPEVEVVQWERSHPSDDDGIWWFRLPDIEQDIQLESSFGMCPFIVEHDEMQSTAESGRAKSIEEASNSVVDYLRAKQETGG